MIMKLQIKYAILFAVVFFLITPAHAADPVSPDTTPSDLAPTKARPKQPPSAQPSLPPPTAPTPPLQTWEKKAIEGNIKVSEWFNSVAEFLDLFIAGRKVTNEYNETSVRIENASVYREGIGYQNSTAFNVNLRLPNVEEYWNLKFTSYDEERTKREQDNAQYRQRPREQNYGATIGVIRRLGNIRTSFQPRVELQNPLKVSHSLAFDTTADISERAQFNPKIEFFAASDRGTGIFDQANFAIQLDKVYTFSFINQTTYEDKGHLFQVANGIALARPVMKNAGISYSLFFNSNNQTTYHLHSYSVAAGWSQVIYKSILDYNVTPHVDFAKDLSFTGRFGLDFNVNLKF